MSAVKQVYGEKIFVQVIPDVFEIFKLYTCTGRSDYLISGYDNFLILSFCSLRTLQTIMHLNCWLNIKRHILFLMMTFCH